VDPLPAFGAALQVVDLRVQAQKNPRYGAGRVISLPFRHDLCVYNFILSSPYLQVKEKIPISE